MVTDMQYSITFLLMQRWLGGVRGVVSENLFWASVKAISMWSPLEIRASLMEVRSKMVQNYRFRF